VLGRRRQRPRLQLAIGSGAFCYWFRATNSFNAIIPGQAVSYSGKLHVSGEDGFDGWWQGFCDTASYENFETVPYALNNFIKR
jgi:hypothetical protein